jgi:hypothetical protein
MVNVIRVDIEEELAAAERGECLGCRTGLTHKAMKECFLPRVSYVQTMTICPCGTKYDRAHLYSCPECKL